MVELITRKSVFEKHRNIASEIIRLQNLMFEDDIELFENEQDRVEYSKMFDARATTAAEVKRFYKTISFAHSEVESFSSVLVQKLILLLSESGIGKIIVIADLKMNFFGANLKHTYSPVKNAFTKLEKITRSRNYREAFKIDVEDLTEFVDIAFWIERCDASAPEFIFFYYEAAELAFYLCKNGNVHIIEFEIEILTPALLKKQNWYQIEGRCDDKFTKDGKIRGRKQGLESYKQPIVNQVNVSCLILFIRIIIIPYILPAFNNQKNGYLHTY